MKILAVKINKVIDQDAIVLFVNGSNSKIKPAVEIETDFPLTLEKGDIIQAIIEPNDRSDYEIIAIENE